MRIAVLGTRGIPNIQGGVETYCENLYPQLAKDGCEVILFTRRPYVNAAHTSYQGVTLIALNCPKNKYFEAFIHTLIGVFAAARYKPDILHIHAIGPSLFTPLARLLGMKVVITNQGPDYERKKWPLPAKLVLRLAEAAGALWANEIICVSDAIADSIKKKYKRRSTVIPNGVHIPAMCTDASALTRFGLHAQKYILAVGRLVPEKGFHNLIKAFKRVELSGWKLAIVGRADHEDEYSRRLTAEAQQDSRIVLTGFLTGEPLRALYSFAGLFVIPSYHEGLAFVLLEALSFGLPCIASDIPGNRALELSEHSYFPPDSIDELSRKISEHVTAPLGDEERRQQIEEVRRKYNWNGVAKKTLEVYLSLVHNEK